MIRPTLMSLMQEVGITQDEIVSMQEFTIQRDMVVNRIHTDSHTMSHPDMFSVSIRANDIINIKNIIHKLSGFIIEGDMVDVQGGE